MRRPAANGKTGSPGNRFLVTKSSDPKKTRGGACQK